MPKDIDRGSLEQAIIAMELQRAILGDAVVDTALTVLNEKLAQLNVIAVSAGNRYEPEHELQNIGQRKQVIALVADVAGYTALSTRLDAGSVRDLMEGLWRRLDNVIKVREGSVYQHVGDALVALWGMPATGENDPEQAIRAALDLQEALREDNSARSVGGSGGENLGMRVGIHAGLALLQPGDVPGKIVVSGEPLIGADALQREAPVGGVIISYDTLRLVRGVFSVEEKGSISLPGRTELVATYLVKYPYPRAFYLGIRDIEGVETHMVGREKELKLLQDLFHLIREDGLRRTATISGEAGVGKSRLIYEFEKWIDLFPEPIWYFKGRASRDMLSLPYSLIRDMFAYRFQIQDSDMPEEVRKKIEDGIAEVMGPGDEVRLRAHFIGHLLGVDFSESPYLKAALADSRQIRDRAIAYLHEYFTAASTNSPAVVLLEDIHWADDSSLDLLETLTRQEMKQRVLLVCAARPALLERRPHWGENQPLHSAIQLQPLPAEAVLRLVSEILQRIPELPAVLSEMIVENTSGNPFYVEELIKMLIEDGVIHKGDEKWEVAPERLTLARVPATLEGVLQARLDSLPVEERNALQRAAVVGPVFWDEALSFIENRTSPSTGLIPALDGLAAKEMVFASQRSSFAQAREFMFKHTMLREVAYQGLLKRERRTYHARVAEWMEKETSKIGREGEYAALIAEHYDQAGNSTAALEWYSRTGIQAAARFGNTEAVRCFSRALTLAAETDVIPRFNLLLAREQVLDLLGERLLQSGDLDDLDDLAKLLQDHHRQSKVALRRANFWLVTGNFQKAEVSAQGAYELARLIDQRQEAIAQESRALLAWGHVLWRQARYAEAREKLENALRLAREFHIDEVKAESLRLLGILANDQGDYLASKQYYEQALRLYRAASDRQGEGNTLASLGNLAIDMGDHVAARAYHEQSLKIKREIGDRRGEGRALGSLGYVASDQGDYAASREYFEKAIGVFRDTGDRQGESVALVNLGSDALIQGDYFAARAYQEQAISLQRENGDRQGECIALDNLSLIYHHLGEHRKALDTAKQAQKVMIDQGLRHLQGYALMHQGHALFGLGEYEEAISTYQKALELRLELGEANLAAESRAGLARVYQQQGKIVSALAQAIEIYNFLQTGSVDGMVEPFFVYLVLYQVFHAAGDYRATFILKEGYERLQARADKIPDPALRQSFMQNVSAHREILARIGEMGQSQ
jgi:tetratricopeptide (TPR) repeat protein/class 3 adenylate cyclase